MFRFFITLFVTVMLLMGCASSGPINAPNFDSNFTAVIDEQEKILLYGATQLRAGTYMEAEIKMVPSYWGVMVLTDRYVRFLRWDDSISKYEVALTVGYQQVLQTKYQFNTLISSFVAIRLKTGDAYALMLEDDQIKQATRIIQLGMLGHLNHFIITQKAQIN